MWILDVGKRKQVFVRKLQLLFYLIVLKHLPPSYYPGGWLVKATRYYFCRSMFKSCGRGVVIETNAKIPFHKVEIGNFSGIGLNAFLGAAKIGDNVMMGPDVIMMSRDHLFQSRSLPMRLQGAAEDNPVVIGDDVWIGTRAILLPGVRVGKGAIIGAGAVVTKNIPEYSIVAGNPARIVGYRPEDDKTSD